MKAKILMGLVIAMSCATVVSTPNWTDDELGMVLRRMFRRLHETDRSVEELLARIHFASNRLVSAAKAVYTDRNSIPQQRVRALSLVSRYGAPQDVDFLMSCASDPDSWYGASIGVLSVLGPTSNGLARLDTLMRHSVVTNGKDSLEIDKAYVVRVLLKRAARPGISPADRERAWHYAFAFASNHVERTRMNDMGLVSFDKSFARSRRRLELLRHLLPQIKYPDLRDYVASEIGKLEALPASELVE